MHTHEYAHMVASFPDPPNFPLLVQYDYHTASNEKLGKGLGMRQYTWVRSSHVTISDRPLHAAVQVSLFT